MGKWEGVDGYPWSVVGVVWPPVGWGYSFLWRSSHAYCWICIFFLVFISRIQLVTCYLNDMPLCAGGDYDTVNFWQRHFHNQVKLYLNYFLINSKVSCALCHDTNKII